MRLLRPALLVSALSAAAALPAHAAPGRFALMGVGLYISAQDVLTALYAQGVRPEAVQEEVHPCRLHAASSCTGRIAARLADGALEIGFTDSPPGFNEGREAVSSVTYTLRRNPPEAAAVRAVAEERFGALTDAADGAWCVRSSQGGCPPDQPRMTVTTSPDGSVVLSLTDRGLPARLDRAEAK